MSLTKPVRLCVGVGFAGICCLGLAFALSSPWHWVALWAALACLVVSAAYGLNRPDVFGKRAGRRAMPHTVLTAPYLAALWIACVFLRLKRRLAAVSLVAPGLYVAGRIRPGDLPADVEYVVDLTAEFSEPAPIRAMRGYRCFPLLDGSYPPREDELIELLAELAEAEGGVLVHCESGVGRAPTMAALILMARGQAADPAAAIDLMKRSRPAVKPTVSDYRFMKRMRGILQRRQIGQRHAKRSTPTVTVRAEAPEAWL